MNKEWKYIIFIGLISLICLILLLRSCKNDQIIHRIEELREINSKDTLEDEVSIQYLKDTVIIPPEVLIRTVREEFIPQGFIDSLENIIAENKRLKNQLKSKAKVITKMDTVIVYKDMEIVNSPDYKITKSSNLLRDEYTIPMIDPVTSDIRVEVITRSKYGISAQLGYGAVYLNNQIGLGPYLGIGIHYEY